MTEAVKPEESFHITAAKEVAPVNQAVLLTATVAGALATAAVDVGSFSRSVPWLATACIGGWVLAMLLTMVLIGRGQPLPGPTGSGTLWRYFKDGWYRCITRKRYTLLLALMAGLAAYAVFAKLKQPEGGVLANVFSALKDIQTSSKETAADVKVIRSKLETPEMQASQGGYPPTPFGAGEAVAKGDLKGLKLVQAAGVKTVALNQGANSPIARLIELKDSNVAELLDAAGLAGPELDLRFPVRQVNGKSSVPEFAQLLSARGIRVVPDEDPFRDVEVMYSKSTNAAWSEQRAEVSPLVHAVWLNRPDAVKALLERKAQPNSSAVFKLHLMERHRNTNPDKQAARAYPYVLGSREAVLEVSALSEAKRLGRGDIEALLNAANARAEVALK